MLAETEIQNLDLALSQSVQEVVERMCFTMIDSLADPPPEHATPCLEVKLNFRGARDGSFWLRVPRQTAHKVAASFSGADSPYDQKTEDVVRELASIMCGAILSRIADDGIFDLDSPVASWITNQAPGPRLVDYYRADFRIGRHVLSAAIAFQAGS